MITMRSVTRRSLASLGVCAVTAAFTLPAMAQESPAHAHMGHVADGFGNTPDGEGLLPTAIAEAEVMYFNDHGTFTDDFMHFGDAVGNSLTTPIAYIAEYPVDPFQKFRNQTLDFPHYRIGTGNTEVSVKNGFRQEGCRPIIDPSCGEQNERHPATADTFVIVSKGPDDLDSGGPVPFYPHPNPESAPSYRIYSPTNGTYSNGDMFRFGGSIPVAFKFLIGG